MAGEKLTKLGYTQELLDGKAPQASTQQPPLVEGGRKAFIAGLPPAESERGTAE